MHDEESLLRQEQENLRREIAELKQRLFDRDVASPELRQFFTSTRSMLCIAGFDGIFKLLSPGWEKVFGFTCEELMAEPFMSFVHPDDHEGTAQAAQALADGHEVFGFKNRYRTSQGEYRWIEWTVMSAPAQQLIYGLARDIDDVTKAEAEKRKIEERMRHVLRASRVLLYTARPGSAFSLTFISENVFERFGYEAHEVLASPSFWLDRIMPEDVANAVKRLSTVEIKESYGCDYRFLHKNGTYRWVHDECVVQRDEHGNALEVIGTYQDITERRQADLVIQAQASALMDLSTPLIPISDRVLAMPLVGTMDTRRAQHVLETLLDGITARSADVAIIDVTGVAVVDTQVANALLRAAKAAQLLGAQVILTGIRSEVAQTLVTLGANLGSVVTLGTLQAGIEYATRRK